ncbi:Phosphate-regulating neutral endopeptidase [Aphelenchoides bicaudatus]|nr:Phosphate-regulating neutral endopeptidase [Aphelenchoides bicaudatus]
MQWLPLILLLCLYLNVLAQSNCTSVECQENNGELKIRMSPSKRRGKCGDTSKNCKHWARQGLCRSKKRSSQMKINLCSQTCNRCSNNNNSGKKKREKPYSVWQNSLDERQDPCQNFYQFTCGTYIKQNKPKTPNSVTSPLTEIGQKVAKQKLELILDNSETDSTAIQKLRQYRDTCKNQTAVEVERTISLRKDIESLGGCPMLVGRSKWKSSNFDLTNALIGFTNFSSNEFIVDIIPDKMNDGNIYLRFWPAQLIVKVPMIYNETRAEQKIQFLEDFLISLMSIVASDMRSGQTFASISKAIKEVIQLDKKFAGALAPFWPAPTDPDEFEKKSC